MFWKSQKVYVLWRKLGLAEKAAAVAKKSNVYLNNIRNNGNDYESDDNKLDNNYNSHHHNYNQQQQQQQQEQEEQRNNNSKFWFNFKLKIKDWLKIV